MQKMSNKCTENFTIQGYILDKERMKNGSIIDKDYFEKLLERTNKQHLYQSGRVKQLKIIKFKNIYK